MRISGIGRRQWSKVVLPVTHCSNTTENAVQKYYRQLIEGAADSLNCTLMNCTLRLTVHCTFSNGVEPDRYQSCANVHGM